MDSLDVGVVGKSVLAKLSSDTALLKASKRYLSSKLATIQNNGKSMYIVVELVIAINPYGASLQLVGNVECSADVSGEDCSGQTVDGVVCDSQEILLVGELGDDDDRAEDLLLDDLGVGVDVFEDCGSRKNSDKFSSGTELDSLDKVTLVTKSVASHCDLGSGLLAVVNVGHDSVELELRDLGTLEGVCLEWITDLQGRDLFLECLHELVVDAILNVDSRSGAAALTVVEEETESSPLDGLVEIGVLADDVGRLASQFEGDLLQVGLGSGLHNGSANEGGTSEGNLLDVHVRCNGGASDLAVTADDVDDTGWEDILDQLGDFDG